MPAQALYLKYRPRTFNDVEGQEHVTQTLRNAIALGRVAHAYLFAGPRGTGKTTIARILAKAVNCLSEKDDKPDNTCAICTAINEDRLLDLIEIDAASNTSVDDVRDLRDKVDFRPGESKYKVYIIDEAHMLSNAAFNALLKTLEEPPPHVIFILATTDSQKIPPTIISRVQRFDFRRLRLEEIIKRLREIAGIERLKIEPAAVELIARQATGAMRDAVSLLDQLMSFGGEAITLKQVQGLLGAAPQQVVGELVGRIAEKNIAAGLEVISSAVDSGADPRQLAREVVEYFRAMLLVQVGGGKTLVETEDALREITAHAKSFSSDQILHCIRLFNQAAYELRASVNPTLPLEIALAEATLEPAITVSTVAPREASPSLSIPKAQTRIASSAATTPTRPVVEKIQTNNTSKASSPEQLNIESVKQNWSRLLAIVRPQNKMAEALLRDAEPMKVEGSTIVLGFHYEGHAERFEKQAKGKSLIEKALEEIFLQPCGVKCVLSPQQARRKTVEKDPLIKEIIKEFKGEIRD